MRSSCGCQHAPERGVPARRTAGRPPWTALARRWDHARVEPSISRPRHDSPGPSSAVIAALLVAAAVLLVMGIGTPLPEASFGFKGWGLILASAFGVAGDPDRRRGSRRTRSAGSSSWRAIGTAVQELATHYAQYGLYVEPGSLPGADVGAWITEWIWIPYMASVALLIPMLYPTGTLPSPRWRVPLVVGLDGCPLRRTPLRARTRRPRRLPRHPEPGRDRRRDWIRPAGNLVMLVFLGGVLCAIASMAMRYRRSHGDERQQLKWLLLSLALTAGAFIVGIPYWTLGGGGTSGDLARSDRVPAGRRPRLDPGGDRGRDLEVPPLRHRRRDQEDGGVRDPRGAAVRARRRRGLGRCRARGGGGRGGRVRVPGGRHRGGRGRLAAPEGGDPDRRSARVRSPCDAVPGDERVLRSRGGNLRERRRPGADGAGAGDRCRRRGRDRLAAGRCEGSIEGRPGHPSRVERRVGPGVGRRGPTPGRGSRAPSPSGCRRTIR